MSKVWKLALIFAVALVAIGAKQLTSPPIQHLVVEPDTAALPGTLHETARDTDPDHDWIVENREWLYRSP
jgi:hypothetical protein